MTQPKLTNTSKKFASKSLSVHYRRSTTFALDKLANREKLNSHTVKCAGLRPLAHMRDEPDPSKLFGNEV
jgi:hypothetical protein